MSYCPNTGELRWNSRDSKSFNTRYAGKIAGSVGTKGHIYINLYKENFLAHRLAWFLYYGHDPVTYQIDHINRNKLDNSINNLRLANHSLNSQNRTGVRGYRLHRGKYEVAISVNKVVIPLGSFYTEAEAQAAYDIACETYKPQYQFTNLEQTLLDELHRTYPNCDPELQRACHELQVKALKFYVDAAIVQTPNLEYNISS